MVENTITATSKATGEAILLTRDPFGQSGAISSIYVDEDACYYASSGEVGDGFQIYRIDLKDFSTRLYFSTGSDNTATFWGLFDHEPTIDELLADVGSTSFVIDGNYIYYLQGGRLYKVFRWTGWETVVVPNVEGMHSLGVYECYLILINLCSSKKPCSRLGSLYATIGIILPTNQQL